MSSNIPAKPFLGLDINGKAFPYHVHCAEIIQEVGKHTIALVEVWYQGPGNSRGNTKTRGTWSYLKEKTPVRITYGMYPTYTQQQLGYVASYKVMKTTKDPIFPHIMVTKVQYTIVGTSMFMQSTVNKEWKNMTPSSIAAAIAIKNGLRPVIHTIKTAQTFRLQSKSDFRFLTELAEEVGFRFYVDNTDLYFVDPEIVVQKKRNDIPRFWSFNQPGIKDTIEEFKPRVGTTTSGKLVADRQMSGLTSSGFFVSAQNQFKLYEAFDDTPHQPIITHYENFPVESYAEAQQRLEYAKLRNRQWAQAEVTVWGDARAKPNGLVDFVGVGVPEDDQGIWLVEKAVHKLEMPATVGAPYAGSYHIDMLVGRDQAFDLTYFSPSKQAPASNTIPSRLINGVWRSTNLGAIAYANKSS